MIKQRLSRNRIKEKKNNQRTASIVSTSFLSLGTLMIVSALLYLLVNLEKSDSLVIMLIPLFVGGLCLIIVSQIIKPFILKLRR